ncbi:MAG: D-tyrosyl-tRNA(Tyr) deacylase [Myxococcales bacterium]|nr:D-tyrosyl-tRNA(Tyr) deacylase [Myxococcales bacterium]
MRAVVQRVSSARIAVDEETVGEIGPGLLALVGVGREDDLSDAEELAKKIVHLRVFADADGRMNRSLLDCGYSLALVSQFTLYGDARKGRRPYFGAAAPPEVAAPLIESLATAVRSLGVQVACGRFQAHMDVSLVNEGPVTILLDTKRLF